MKKHTWMKKVILYTVLLCCALQYNIYSNVTYELQGSDLYVYTDQEGQAGHKGCLTTTYTETSAYIFELSMLEELETTGCDDEEEGTQSSGIWTPTDKIQSDHPVAVFRNVPIGKYRVKCLYGRAEGCDITDEHGRSTGQQSIVYRIDQSDIIHVGSSPMPELQTVSAESAQTNSWLHLFPNPASHNLNYDLHFGQEDIESSVTLFLYNISGKVVYVENRECSHCKGSIDVGTFLPGTYFLAATNTRGQRLLGKVILAKD